MRHSVLGKRAASAEQEDNARKLQETEAKCTIADIPAEILLTIFRDYIGNTGANICSVVCRKWRSVVKIGWPGQRTFGTSAQWINAVIRDGNRGVISGLVPHLVNPRPTPGEIMKLAAAYGALDFLKEYLPTNISWVDRTCIGAAACNDQLSCLEYICENYGRRDRWMLAKAAEGGSVRCLDYLASVGCVAFGIETVERAARNGNLEALRWCWNQGVGVSFMEAAAIAAAEGGHIDCLEYAAGGARIGRGIEMKIFKTAARYGQLSVLVHLHEKRRWDWNASVCKMAAYYGRLDCLIYLHENGCPWDWTTLRDAKYMGHKACYEYAIAQGCGARPW